MSPTMLCPRCWGAPQARLDALCGCCSGVLRVPDEALSQHFLLSELVQSPFALRLGIANDPSPDVVANLRVLAHDVLEPLRQLIGAMRVTSGYRSLALNAAVSGASTTSAHPEGHACDFVPARGLRESFEMLLASGLVFDQAIFEGTWIHVGRRKNGVIVPRRQTLQMFGGRYSAYDATDPRVR